ncbi:hypothetical protein CAOG_08513 [Capsaspora owczarzaki ATCC 30864]|uniref:Uncharacterized protein n=1 Tax=Capsaspora owczarzaki (strain ATCC 30864) TaxID=595528 RepID=A0A0D2WKL2_CAPO3|nr:hypothetical protein CAOG_08513 [Capsaspora owczarzaki ATCC 30864]KJE90143.1 hypothetical protein CAOG_008513 [Capsaspora owczarzaki ATCC 30864]|eukprot:XP_011270095.1 hypothetical protein CAOG_08513 [Capsaspora owczarzaki ATCC 30864]
MSDNNSAAAAAVPATSGEVVREISQTDHLNKKLLQSFMSALPTMNIPVPPAEEDDDAFDEAKFEAEQALADAYMEQLAKQFAKARAAEASATQGSQADVKSE